MSWHEDFSEADYQHYWSLSPEARGELLANGQIVAALKALLLYQQGRQALGSNDVNTAIACFVEVLSLKPGWHEAWSGHAAALLKAGEHESAIASCTRALELESTSAEAWSLQGGALFRLGRYEAAVNSCDRALELQPDDHQAWSTLSDALAYQKRYAEAVISYDKALALNSEEPFLWGNRGAALQNLGRYEEAIASYDKLLQAEPTRYKLWHQRGLALRKLRRYEAAIASFDEALIHQPDFYAATRSKLFTVIQAGRLWRYAMGDKTLIERGHLMNDLRNVLDSVVKTKLPTLVVIALLVLSSTHSRVVALAIAGVFLLIAAIGDFIAESQR